MLTIGLTACSGTPNCESIEASNWFKDNLSPQINELISKAVQHAPVFYVLDEVETIHHNKETDSYSCKAILRLNLSAEDNKVVTQFDQAIKKDPAFAQIVENQLNEKMSKENGLFILSSLTATAINTKSLQANTQNPSDIKYHFDFPVKYSTHKIKSSAEKFQLETDLKENEVEELLNAHSILFIRLALAKNLMDHPELITKIRTEKAEIEAKKAKEKQDAIDQENAQIAAQEAERVAAKEKEIEDKKAAEESKQKFIREETERRQQLMVEARALEEKKIEERKLRIQEEKLKFDNARLEREAEANKRILEENQNLNTRRKRGEPTTN